MGIWMTHIPNAAAGGLVALAIILLGSREATSTEPPSVRSPEATAASSPRQTSRDSRSGAAKGALGRLMSRTTRLPDDYPDDLPRYSGWTVHQAIRMNAFSYSIDASTLDAPKKVSNTLIQAATKAGWERESMPRLPAGSDRFIRFRKAGRLMTIALLPAGEQTMISIETFAASPGAGMPDGRTRPQYFPVKPNDMAVVAPHVERTVTSTPKPNVKLPADWPKDLPIYPGWHLEEVIKPGKSEGSWTLVGYSSDPFAQVVKSLRQQMLDKGWGKGHAIPDWLMAKCRYSKGDRLAGVDCFTTGEKRGGGRTQITIRSNTLPGLRNTPSTFAALDRLLQTTELPEDFPKDIPVYPGWTVHRVFDCSLVASTPDPPEKVSAGLNRAATRAGWKRERYGGMSMKYPLKYEMGERFLWIILHAAGGRTEIHINSHVFPSPGQPGTQYEEETYYDDQGTVTPAPKPAVQLPANWPGDLPKYPNWRLVEARRLGETPNSWSLIGYTPDPLANVSKSLRQQMLENGWTEKNQDSYPGPFFAATYLKGGRRVRITCSLEGKERTRIDIRTGASSGQ